MKIDISDYYDQLLTVHFKDGKVLSAAFYALPGYNKETVKVREMADKAVKFLEGGLKENGNQNSNR